MIYVKYDTDIEIMTKDEIKKLIVPTETIALPTMAHQVGTANEPWTLILFEKVKIKS